MAVGAKEVEAGGAFVRMKMRDETTGGLTKLGQKLKAFGGMVAGVGAGLMGLGVGILGVFAKSALQFSETGSALKDASDRTGIAAEDLDALGFAAEQSGASFEDLEKSIRKMQVQGLGVGLDDFRKYAEEIANIEDADKRAARAMDVFGKSGANLLPLLKTGAKGVDELMEEAKRLGIVMSTEDAEAAERFGDQLGKLERVFKRTFEKLGASVVPLITEFMDKLVEGAGAVANFANNNRGLLQAIAALGVALVAGGAALIAIGGAISLAGVALVGLKAVLIGGLIAGVAALQGYLISLIPGVRELAKTIWDNLVAAFQRVKESFGGMADALKAGDWTLAVEIAWVRIQAEFARGAKAVRNLWANMIDGLAAEFDAFGSRVTKKFLQWGGFGFMGRGGLDAEDAQRAEARDAVNKQRNAQFDGKIAELEARAKALNAEAAAKANPPKPADFKKAPSMTDAVQIFAQQKGTFAGGSAASRALGIADKLSEKLLNANEETAKNTKQIAQQVEKLNRAE